MTAIAPLYIKTKKQLKSEITEGQTVFFDDPTPWGSRTIEVNPEAGTITVDYLEQPPGFFFTCTNHPRRSWFAEISIDASGTIKVK